MSRSGIASSCQSSSFAGLSRSVECPPRQTSDLWQPAVSCLVGSRPHACPSSLSLPLASTEDLSSRYVPYLSSKMLDSADTSGLLQLRVAAWYSTNGMSKSNARSRLTYLNKFPRSRNNHLFHPCLWARSNSLWHALHIPDCLSLLWSSHIRRGSRVLLLALGWPRYRSLSHT